MLAYFMYPLTSSLCNRHKEKSDVSSQAKTMPGIISVDTINRRACVLGRRVYQRR